MDHWLQEEYLVRYQNHLHESQEVYILFAESGAVRVTTKLTVYAYSVSKWLMIFTYFSLLSFRYFSCLKDELLNLQTTRNAELEKEFDKERAKEMGKT